MYPLRFEFLSSKILGAGHAQLADFGNFKYLETGVIVKKIVVARNQLKIKSGISNENLRDILKTHIKSKIWC